MSAPCCSRQPFSAVDAASFCRRFFAAAGAPAVLRYARWLHAADFDYCFSPRRDAAAERRISRRRPLSSPPCRYLWRYRLTHVFAMLYAAMPSTSLLTTPPCALRQAQRSAAPLILIYASASAARADATPFAAATPAICRRVTNAAGRAAGAPRCRHCFLSAALPGARRRPCPRHSAC